MSGAWSARFRLGRGLGETGDLVASEETRLREERRLSDERRLGSPSAGTIHVVRQEAIRNGASDESRFARGVGVTRRLLRGHR
jgi:hypothetical protein